jgi:hypothetical protein
MFGVLVVATLMAVSTVALAAVEQTQSYKDVFPDITYAGSAGSIRWENSWLEIGEKDGPGEGMVRVYTGGCYDYKCLIIEGHGDVGTLGAERYADLSFFENADLCFDIVAQIEGDEKLSEGELWIQVTTDGQSWKTIDSFNLQNLSGNAIHRQRELIDYLSEGFGIRFIVTGTLEGEVYVDNVEIKGPVVVTSTTSTATPSTSSTTSTTEPKAATTTTKPRNTTTTTERDTTTTTTAETTTTTVLAAVPLGPTEPPTDSGLRETANGVQANYSQELFGAMDMGDSEVLSVAFEANYSMAVEVFSATWIWMVALVLIIATAIVTGLDRRRPARAQSAA